MDPVSPNGPVQEPSSISFAGRVRRFKRAAFRLSVPVTVGLAALEWGHAKGLEPMPWAATGIAAAVMAWPFLKTLPGRLGARRPLATPDGIDESMSAAGQHGYRVFERVRLGEYEIGRVLVGPGGLFAVHAQQIDVPLRGRREVVVADGTLFIHNRPVSNEPLGRVQGMAKALEDALRPLMPTRPRQFVRPVLLFPGWYVIGRHRTVWILDPAALPSWLVHEPEVLAQEDRDAYGEALEKLSRQSDPWANAA